MNEITAVTGNLAVPSLQWWRIIFCFAVFRTSSTVANRLVDMELTSGTLSNASFVAPAVQTASVTCSYTFGPGLTSYAAPVVAGGQGQMVALVDVLWPQGSGIAVELVNNQTGDQFATAPTLAVEIYTEYVDDTTGITSLVPTPTLT